MGGGLRPRLCKNVFERARCSKPDWKSRFYAKSTSANVPINFRFNVDAHTSILAKRFYTLWARSGRPVGTKTKGKLVLRSIEEAAGSTRYRSNISQCANWGETDVGMMMMCVHLALPNGPNFKALRCLLN